MKTSALMGYLMVVALVVAQSANGDVVNEEESHVAAAVQVEEPPKLVQEFARRLRKRKGKPSNGGNSETGDVAQGPNNPVCYEIKNTWWSQRQNAISQGNVNEWDTICQNFEGDRDACVYGNSQYRQKYVDEGKITAAQMGTPCVPLGAHSPRCVGNFCNNFNTGECTLQNTGGLCNWYTKSEAKKYGLLYGCNRNRCNIGGTGKVTAEYCEAQGIPGFVECTYCQGANDPQLKGLGMGCQRTVPTTVGQCAPVNNKNVPKNTIYENKNQKDCQCSDQTRLCQEVVQARDSPYVKRY